MKKYIITFFGLISIFILLLTIVSAFPSSWIKDNVYESAVLLKYEGNRKWTYVLEKLEQMQFDNYTDALMINTAYSIDSKTPTYSAFIARKNYIPGVTKTIQKDEVGELKSSSKYSGHDEVGELFDTVNGKGEESFEYARYWHGYLTFLRPLLLVFNLEQIRIFIILICLALAGVLAYLINKEINTKSAIIVMLGLLGVEYFIIGLSMQGTPVFLISVIASILIIYNYKKINHIPLVFFIIGMLTNFFDFLTVPMVTWGLPIIIYFMLLQKNENKTLKEQFIIFVKISIAWFLGYILTWLTKWYLVDIFYGRDLIKVAIGQIFYRSVGQTEVEGVSALYAIKYNVDYMIIPLFISLLIIIDKGINILCIYHKKHNVELKISNSIIYLIIAITPFIWYILLTNHSCYHAFFTYRNLLLTIIALPIGIDKLCDTNIKKGAKELG